MTHLNGECSYRVNAHIDARRRRKRRRGRRRRKLNVASIECLFSISR